MGRWQCLSPHSCLEAPYRECVTLTSLRKSLLHLLSLPHWHGFPQASHPGVAALGWSLCTSQLVEGSLGWQADGLSEALASDQGCSD